MTPAVSIATQTVEPTQAWAEEGVLEPIASEEASYASTDWYHTTETEGDWDYWVDGDKAYIGSYHGDNPNVTIPLKIGGLPVEEVRGSAFQNNTTVENVIIPEGITYIHPQIFKDSSVKTVSLPSSLKGWTVRWSTGQHFEDDDFSQFFEDCSQLTAITVGPDNAYVCAENGILYDKNQTELIAYPAARLGTEFTFPESIESIGSGAFASTVNLETLTIPDTVTVNDYSALNGPSIKAFVVAGSHQNYSSKEGVLYDKSGTRLIAYPAGKQEATFSIPEGVLVVESNIFSNTTQLKTLVIPSSVTNISYWYNWSSNNSSIEAINVVPGNSNYSSLNGVLYNKDQTELLVYPANKKDTSFTVPSTVTCIKQGFGNPVNLKELTISNSVVSLEGNYGKSLFIPLVEKLHIGTGLKSVDDSGNPLLSLQGCGFNLQEITVDAGNPYLAMKDDVLYSSDMSEIIFYPPYKSETSFVVPESVTTVEEGAFRRCLGLKEIVFPSKIESLGGNFIDHSCGGYDFDLSNHILKRVVFCDGVNIDNWNSNIMSDCGGKVFIGDDTVRQMIEKTDFIRDVDEYYLDIDLSHLSITIPDQTFNGSAVEPDITFPGTASILEKGKDYEVVYENNTAPGEATLTIKPAEGSYFVGSKTVKFNIAGNASDAVVTIDGETYDVGLAPTGAINETTGPYAYSYNGIAQTPRIVLINTDSASAVQTPPVGSYSVVYQAKDADGDFAVGSTDVPTAVGEYRISIQAGNAAPVPVGTYQITKADINNPNQVIVMWNNEPITTGSKVSIDNLDRWKQALSLAYPSSKITVGRPGDYSNEYTFAIDKNESNFIIDVDSYSSLLTNLSGEPIIIKFEFSSGSTNPPVEPVYPVDPVDPAVPTEPDDPEEPEEPTDPTEPEDPEEPDNPDEPVDPVDPIDPVDPADPEEPTEPVDPTPEEPSDPVEPEDKDNQEGDWKKDHNGWWFHHKDGTYPSDEWVKVDGEWYHFDHHGYMQTGWIKQGGSWYYLKQDGSMATGWNHVNGEWYYCKGKGEGAEGSIATGWQEIDGKWYYLNNSGVMQTGWQKQGNAWYHLADNGVMTTGWQHIDGVWYYLNEAGRMQTGWQEIDGAWHYLDNSGVMQTGWLQQGNKWYYLSSNGQMATDWQKVGGKWYHMNDKGHMQTGWQEIDGKWYYLNASGAMQTNCWVGNYWVDASGVMATNTTVDNGRYQVDENGRWVK